MAACERHRRGSAAAAVPRRPAAAETAQALTRCRRRWSGAGWACRRRGRTRCPAGGSRPRRGASGWASQAVRRPGDAARCCPTPPACSISRWLHRGGCTGEALGGNSPAWRTEDSWRSLQESAQRCLRRAWRATCCSSGGRVQNAGVERAQAIARVFVCLRNCCESAWCARVPSLRELDAMKGGSGVDCQLRAPTARRAARQLC